MKKANTPSGVQIGQDELEQLHLLAPSDGYDRWDTALLLARAGALRTDLRRANRERLYRSAERCAFEVTKAETLGFSGGGGNRMIGDDQLLFRLEYLRRFGASAQLGLSLDSLVDDFVTSLQNQSREALDATLSAWSSGQFGQVERGPLSELRRIRTFLQSVIALDEVDSNDLPMELRHWLPRLHQLP